jgi:cysteinyl-tRNA synthetase
MRAMGRTLGLLQQDPDAYLKRGVKRSVAQERDGEAAAPAAAAGADRPVNFADAEIEALLAARQAARGAKNFAESDRIREQLRAGGILLEDKPGGGTDWRRA